MNVQFCSGVDIKEFVVILRYCDPLASGCVPSLCLNIIIKAVTRSHLNCSSMHWLKCAAAVRSHESEEDETCDVDGLLGSAGDAAVSTLHGRELHQSLPLEGHHHDIAGDTDKEHVHHHFHLVASHRASLSARAASLRSSPSHTDP